MNMREKLLSQVRHLLSETATQAFPGALPVDIADIQKVITQLGQEQLAKEEEIKAAQKEPDPSVRSTKVAQLQGELSDIIAQKSQLAQMQNKPTTSEGFSQLNSKLKLSRADLAEIVREQLDAGQDRAGCPLAAQDVALNTENRNATRENHAYGPLNPSKPSEGFWEKIADKWDATIEEALSTRCANCVAFDISPRMKDCMPLADANVKDVLGDDLPGFDVEEYDVQFGYCWMHHFKCLSARVCDTWASGGPIDENEVSYEWGRKSGTEQEEE